jgi:predicted DsbA family dithiol-disulfide isomerase
MNTSAPVVLDIWSDLVCPWCYIGRTRLEAALRTPGASAPVIRWRAFELQPDLPPEGVEARPFYARKFGGEARVQQLFDQVAGVAAQDGLRLDFSKMRRAPNTRLGHRLVRLVDAGRPEAADALVRALFVAHFTDGLDLSRAEVLLEVAAQVEPALDLEALRSGLLGDAALDDVLADERLAGELGIRGVPFFVAGLQGPRPRAVSGAQAPEAFLRLLAA